MEFNDDEEDEAQEEEEEMNLPQNDTVFTSPHLETTTTTTTSTTSGGLMVLHTGTPTGNTTGTRFRYRECLKNQAVNIGGHALDGCGEFMPAGSEGTIESLKCAACNCHRNFHRKETNHPIPPPGFYRIPTPVTTYHQRPILPPPAPPLALPPPPIRERSDLEDELNNKMDTSSAEGGGGNMMRNKRFRTKFTAEQKEMMLGLAERIGWRIQRQDDELISRFCQESGVSRQVLKVWLHNNKHTLGKSSSSTTSPPPINISHHHHQHQQHQHHHHQQNQSLFHQEQDQP